MIDPDFDRTSEHAPFFDALALIHAQDRHDGPATERILDLADLRDLALVLSQHVQVAIRAQGMSLDQFLEMLTDKLVSKEAEAADARARRADS